MPLTNEAVIPVGKKDFWNALTPYQEITDTTCKDFVTRYQSARKSVIVSSISSTPKVAPLFYKE